jgi:hypothetical protein
MDFIVDLWAFRKFRTKIWLLPVIVAMALFGNLIVLSQGSVIKPFIYAII